MARAGSGWVGPARRSREVREPFPGREPGGRVSSESEPGGASPEMMSRRDSNVVLMLLKDQLDSEASFTVSVFSLVLTSSVIAVHVTFPTEMGSTRTLPAAVHTKVIALITFHFLRKPKSLNIVFKKGL